jgi:bacterioferritin
LLCAALLLALGMVSDRTNLPPGAPVMIVCSCNVFTDHDVRVDPDGQPSCTAHGRRSLSLPGLQRPMRAMRAHHPAHHGRSTGRRRAGVLPRRPPARCALLHRDDNGPHGWARHCFSALSAFLAATAIICRARPLSAEHIQSQEHNHERRARRPRLPQQGLRHELTAINQYWLHYRLLDNWGYKSLAKQWRKESIEEMQHADKLVDRIIFLDGFPNMQVLDPLHIGQNVKEVLDCDLAAEVSARALYEEAATHCHSVGITSRATCSRN